MSDHEQEYALLREIELKGQKWLDALRQTYETPEEYYRCVNGTNFNKRPELLKQNPKLCNHTSSSVLCSYSCYIFKETDDNAILTLIQRKNGEGINLYIFKRKDLIRQRTLEDFG